MKNVIFTSAPVIEERDKQDQVINSTRYAYPIGKVVSVHDDEFKLFKEAGIVKEVKSDEESEPKKGK